MNFRGGNRYRGHGASALAVALLFMGTGTAHAQTPAAPPPQTADRPPNILVIFGDDIGQFNISAYSFGLVGYKTPNIDRIAP